MSRILVVDDEIRIVELLRMFLETEGHDIIISLNGRDALEKVEREKPDLILLDINMPAMDGLEVVRQVRKHHCHSELPIIMVTGQSNPEDRISAVEAGANDFIAKPFDKTEVHVRTSSLLETKNKQDELKRYHTELEKKVEQRTAALQNAFDNTIKARKKTLEAHIDTIQRLVIAAEYKDEDTANHIRRMSGYCKVLGIKRGLSGDEINLLCFSSAMHDVGKIGTPDAVLLKPTSLTPEEWDVMKQHTVIGGRILCGSSSGLLQAGEVIALTHHEKWDGSGYPKGLAGEDIPLWGRISAVADVFDALTSVRPYKKKFSNEKALEFMQKKRGNHFDPELVDLFILNLDEIFAIQKKYSDS